MLTLTVLVALTYTEPELYTPDQAPAPTTIVDGLAE
jgi:hypothetical protein